MLKRRFFVPHLVIDYSQVIVRQRMIRLPCQGFGETSDRLRMRPRHERPRAKPRDPTIYARRETPTHQTVPNAKAALVNRAMNKSASGCQK